MFLVQGSMTAAYLEVVRNRALRNTSHYPRKHHLKCHVTLNCSFMLACSNHLSDSRNDPFLTTYPFIKHKKTLHYGKETSLPWQYPPYILLTY